MQTIDAFSYFKRRLEPITQGAENFRNLNAFIGKQQGNSFCKSFLSTCTTVAKACYVNCFNRLNKNINYIDKHTAVLTYVLDGRLYKIALTRRKGPPQIIMVHDENDDDISNEILPYLGPCRDWHKKEYTPEFWGKNKLFFETVDGETLSFEKKETIDI